MKRALVDTPDLVRRLKSLGITQYEALVYIALLRVSSATASEIHESSGVPRASVYPVIDQLLEKDLVSVSQSSPKRFAAVPPTEAIDRLTARIDQDARMALESLSAIHREMMVTEQGGGELIWNLYGNAAIRKRMAELIAGARTDIRIIIQPRILSADIRAALKKCPASVNIEIITSEWDGPVPKTLNLHLRHHPGIAGAPDCIKDMMGGGICIIDSSRVMVIIGSGEDDTVALFSESEGFVSFFIRYYSLLRDWAKKGD